MVAALNHKRQDPRRWTADMQRQQPRNAAGSTADEVEGRIFRNSVWQHVEPLVRFGQEPGFVPQNTKMSQHVEDAAPAQKGPNLAPALLPAISPQFLPDS